MNKAHHIDLDMQRDSTNMPPKVGRKCIQLCKFVSCLVPFQQLSAVFLLNQNYSGVKIYLVSHQLYKASHLKR